MPPSNSSFRKSVNSSISSPWYRSLYWRIAAGLFAFLALMLAAEGALFLWMSDRIAASMPSRSPRMLGLMVASDVGSALDADPQLDLTSYVRDQFGAVLQPFVVVMRDGRIAANQDEVPEELLDAVRREPFERPFGGRGRGGPPDGSAQGPPPPFGEPSRRPPRGRGESVPIMIDGRPVGRVVVWMGTPPIGQVVRRLGPMLALMAGSVLVIGTALIALFVFGPTRKRLQDVERATAQLGAGDLTARAPEHGGDEVSALGRSFNRMADELASRARALEASDRVRRQLLADVSHELMTPLTAMRGYVETLAMSEAQFDAPTRERYLNIALEETHRLERIIGDLLDLARLEGGGGVFRHEAVDVALLFGRVAARHERELVERGVTLRARVEPGAERITADPDRLEQALQNLAANALRHTPAGGEIALTSAVHADGIALSVSDTGPGIAAEHLPLIFDRFYKADASRQAAGGSGLGLSIVRAIIERHGGTIAARNDRGAVFDIVLPQGHSDRV
jgi:signal transduction histidine kinase